MRARTMRCALGLLVLAVLGWPTQAAAQKFFPDDPLVREPAPLPAVDPGARNLSLLLEAASATFGKPGERQPAGGVIAGEGVNTLGEVLDGPWFVNRHGRVKLSLDELRRGSGDANPPSTTGPWRVVLTGNRVSRPTIIFRDASEHLFMLRFDPAEAPELATGAEMISSRVFHALGYNVPESYIVVFDRERLVVEDNATALTSIGELRTLLPEDIDRLLVSVARRSDGKYRAVALRVPVEAASLIGPYRFFGTRSDDPNDIAPHEHRRDLRGLYVFSAWLNHTNIDSLHTMDVVTTPDGEPPNIRHYLFDFMATLGSELVRAKRAWEGRDPIYRKDSTLKNVIGLGIYTPSWMRADYPDLPAVGRFESKTFEPDKWSPAYDLAPFANRLPDDTFWAARQVVAFSDEDIRAIAQVAQYSDPKAERWIADSLIDRRNRIGRTYFTRVLPLVDFAVRSGELVFTDVAAQHGFAQSRPYKAEWWIFDNQTGKPTTRIESNGLQVPAGAANVPPGSYVLALLTGAADSRMAVRVYLRNEPGGLRVVGIDRDWPGRTLVDRRVVVRPIRNRYAEFEPERQLLFAGYNQQLNAKGGQNLAPADRFRSLGPSEQTTFDGVTHALIHSSLTDAEGQSLGRAIDIVASVERIAGQQSGRSGDQQFRLYVTLRPEAQDVLSRSRELVRDKENTVYHPGFPHSYRSGGGAPSVQFSVADDYLSADIDVDYRQSKTPQSLFNGHLTSANSDVRAGDNSQRHDRRWNGFVNWWSNLYGNVKFTDHADEPAGPFGTAPTRTPTALPPNRPLNASIPELADAVQEFLTDWTIRRNYEEAAAFLAPDVFACVADSAGIDPKAASADRMRHAAVQLMEKAANEWGHPRNLSEAMNPVFPWSPSVRVVRHTFDRDFTIVEAPSELGAQYACGAPPPPKGFKPSTMPEYGTYFGALFQVVREGQPGGTIVFVWRKVDGEWRIVSYRSVD